MLGAMRILWNGGSKPSTTDGSNWNGTASKKVVMLRPRVEQSTGGGDNGEGGGVGGGAGGAKPSGQ